jgi:hypothetical protein
MSRPKKTETEKAALPPSDPAFPRMVPSMIRELEVDPTNRNELAILFGPIVAGEQTKGLVMHKYAGLILALMIEKAPSEVLAEAFRLILELKRNKERADSGDHSRNPNGLRAWADYVAEMGVMPRKSTLRAFIQKRRTVYKNMPGPDDHAGWTRLWAASYLADMEP